MRVEDIFKKANPIPGLEEEEDETKPLLEPSIAKIFEKSEPIREGPTPSPYQELPPEASKFLATPTGVPARTEEMPLWQKALTILDPLLLPGDVSKAFVYGVATGGWQKGFELAGEQLRRASAYLPGGRPADPVVRGDELARLAVGDEKWESLSPMARLGLSMVMEVGTDPLAAFGLVRGGVNLLTRGAEAGAQALGLTAAQPIISRVGGAIAGTLGSLERALNPYAATLDIARAGVRGARSVVPDLVDSIAERAEQFLQVRVLSRTVLGPQGEKIKMDIRVKDLIFPGFTPRERAELAAKVPAYLGGPDYGAGVMRQATAKSQSFAQAGVAHLAKLEGILSDAFGERVLPISRRLVITDPAKQALAKEISADTWTLLDKYGWDVPEGVMESFRKKIAGLAKASGVDEDLAVRTFEEYHRAARLAYLDATYYTVGMPKFEEVYKRAAQEMGLDPDFAWQKYLGTRIGYMPKIDEAGRIVDLEKVEGALFSKLAPPKLDLETLQKNFLFVYRALQEGVDSPGALRLYFAAPAQVQDEIAKMHPQIVERVQKWWGDLLGLSEEEIANAARIFGERLTTGEIFRPFARQAEPEAEKLIRQLKAAVGKDDPARVAYLLSKVVEKVDGDTVRRLVQSSSATDRAVGYAILGTAYEGIAGGSEMAAIAFTNVVMEVLEKKKLARYFYTSGGFFLDILAPGARANLGPIILEDATTLLKEGKVLDETTVNAVYKWLASVPAGDRYFLLEAIEQFDTPAARLAAAIVEGNRKVLEDIIRDAITGKLPVREGGLERLLGLARRAIGDEGVARIMSELGIAPDMDPAKVRALFVDNLMQAEKRAMDLFWAEHPHWMGAPNKLAMLGEFEDGKWIGYPYSPLQWLADVRQGYARKVYLGNISPEAAKAAILSNRLALVHEAEADTLVSRGLEWLKERGRIADLEKAREALTDLAEYIKASDGRYIYTAEAFAKILKQKWPDLDSATFNALLHDVINGPGKENIAFLVLSKAQSGIDTARLGAPVAQGVPGAERARIDEELTRHLVQMYDVEGSLAEFVRYSSRQMVASHIQDQVYRLLKEAGLIFDEPPVEEIRRVHLRYVQVPETTTYMGEAGGRAYLWGPLAGKWIPRVIYEDMVRVLSVDPLSGTAYSSFLAFWRKGLLNSPDTVVRNFLGNIWLTWLNGGGEMALRSIAYYPKAAQALNEYIRTGRIPELGEGAIHMLKDVSLTRELRQAAEEAAFRVASGFRSLISRRGGVQKIIEGLDAILNDAGRTLSKALGFDPESSPLRFLSFVEIFAHLENLQRVANYFAAKSLAKARGVKDPEAYALWAAMQFTHDYRQIPYALAIVRDYGVLAFPSFMYLTAVATGRAMVKNPTALTLPAKFASMSFYTNTDSPEDHARVAMYMSEWLATAMPMVLPIKREDGSYLVLPLSYATPVMPIEPQSLASEVLGLGVLRPFYHAALGLLTDSPSPLFMAQYGQRLFPDLASPGEKAVGVAGYIAKSFTPRWATRYAGLADLDLLVRDLTHDRRALEAVDSVVGKLYLQYKHPLIVAEMERRLSRQIGMTATEAGLSLLAMPRRVSASPVGVGTRGVVSQAERMEREMQYRVQESLVRGGNPMEVFERAAREMERIRKKLLPLLELNEIFGPPPDLPDEWGQPGGE